MKSVIAILALALLVLPMLAGIARMRRLPGPERRENEERAKGEE